MQYFDKNGKEIRSGMKTVYKIYPQMVGEHIALLRMQFEEKEE